MGRVQEKSGGSSPWEVSSETSLRKSWDSVRWYSWGVRLPIRILDAVRILLLAVEVSLDSLLEDGQVHSGTNASWGAWSRCTLGSMQPFEQPFRPVVESPFVFLFPSVDRVRGVSPA